MLRVREDKLISRDRDSIAYYRLYNKTDTTNFAEAVALMRNNTRTCKNEKREKRAVTLGAQWARLRVWEWGRASGRE